MTNGEWLEERRKGVGGSDIAAILGLSDFSTSYDVWLSKINKAEDKTNRYMEAGRVLEPFIGNWFADRTKRKFRDTHVRSAKKEVYRADAMIYTGKKPHYKASVDFFFDDDGVLECKSTGLKSQTLVPAHYCQGQWYCGIMNKGKLVVSYAYLPNNFNYEMLIKNRHLDLTVLRSALEYKDFEYDRDDDLIGYMQEKADKFWKDYVLTRTMPPPETSEDVVRMFPKSNGKSIEVDDTVFDVYKSLVHYKQQADQWGHKFENTASVIKVMMRDNETAIYAGKTIATFKTNKDSAVFDEKQFKEDDPELYEAYLKTKDGNRVFKLKL